MNASAQTNGTKMSENTKANLIAFGIMAIVAIAGILYGIQLDAIGY